MTGWRWRLRPVLRWNGFVSGRVYCHFEDSGNVSLDAITVNVSSNADCKKHLLAWPGRLGMVAPMALQAEVLEDLKPFMSGNESDDSRPILVLGHR